MSVLKVLNAEGEEPEPASPAPPTSLTLAQQLQRAMLSLKGQYMDDAKGTVDYAAIKAAPEYREYRALTRQLRDADLATLHHHHRTAFFINVYNALTVDSVAQLGLPPASTLEVQDFWGSHAYRIGHHTYTLDVIEHAMLRGNRPHPTTGQPVLPRDDPRLQYRCPRPDPRVHFALNCGAKSCPRVRVYNGEENQLEAGLRDATRSYLQQEVVMLQEGEGGTLRLPRILQWYQDDFAPNLPALLRRIQQYVGEKEGEAITAILAAEGDGDGDNGGKVPKIEYFYDWSLNSA